MGLLKLTTRKRNVPGSLTSNLLSIERSIGYLQGGYKDSILVSKVQLFNTVTQIGRVVYDTGYLRSYHPGMSGANSGYFSINDTVQYNKFDYITATASLTPITTPTWGAVTSVDFGVYSKGWLLTKPLNTTASATVNNWNKVDYSTDSIVSRGLISAVWGTTRQAFGTKNCSVFTDTASFYSFNSTTEVMSNSLAYAVDTYSCGMCKDDTVGYQTGTSISVKVGIANATLQSVTAVTGFSYQFSESHSVTSSTSGYMMAGYADTTGRYASTQHGLCQKRTFATEAITTLADLSIPQSSGQMMQGF